MAAREWDREILRLAWPAFLALVSEPLFRLADSAIVGHLGTRPLAGLGVAAAVIGTLVALCGFLAYGTTGAVARLLGAGDTRGAIAQGLDGIWLALGLGLVLTLAGTLLTDPLVALFRPPAAVTPYAATYLAWAWLGLTGTLVVTAATGLLRGLQDTRTPLLVAVGANLANIGLNWLLVYPLGLGIGGSALGTALAQTGAGAAMLVVAVRGARDHHVSVLPRLAGVGRAARAGVALVVRALTLNGAFLIATYAAAGLGTVALATHQLTESVWMFLAYALDAVAIAAQAIVGRHLGAGDVAGARTVTARMLWWGVVGGVVSGVVVAATAPLLGMLFTTDPQVRRALVPVLLVVAPFQVVAGIVFVLDGVLIGAGDTRYLAWLHVVVLVVFAPVALAMPRLPWLWAAVGAVLLGGRCLGLLGRARTERWLRAGV